MARTVTLRTPVPTLAEVGKSLGLSKARQRSLISIVKRDSISGSSVESGRRSSKKSEAVKRELSASR
jgi:hypothetical protein